MVAAGAMAVSPPFVLCLGGLGTDTGVSVRGPASWLGLVGVRPSYPPGRWPVFHGLTALP